MPTIVNSDRVATCKGTKKHNMVQFLEADSVAMNTGFKRGKGWTKYGGVLTNNRQYLLQ